jgi:hypothetical protein
MFDRLGRIAGYMPRRLMGHMSRRLMKVRAAAVPLAERVPRWHASISDLWPLASGLWPLTSGLWPLVWQDCTSGVRT